MTHLGTILKQQAEKQADPIHDLDRFWITPTGYAAMNEPPVEDALRVRQAYDGPAVGQPDAAWVRGICPECGGPVVANSYYAGGRGYVIVAECWYSLAETPTCNYRKAL